MATYEYQGTRSLQTTLNNFKIMLEALYQKQEAGKGLSTNDLTNELLQKLNGLEPVSASAALTSGNKIASIIIGDDTIDVYSPEVDLSDFVRKEDIAQMTDKEVTDIFKIVFPTVNFD